MTPTSIIVGPPAFGAPSLVSWMPVDALQRLFPDICRAARSAYAKQRYCAGERGIAWLFEFASWWRVWSKSGRWSQRGRGVGKWCMSRPGDRGPYREDNTEIVPFIDNVLEGAHPHTEESIAKMIRQAQERARDPVWLANNRASHRLPSYRVKQSRAIKAVWAAKREEASP